MTSIVQRLCPLALPAVLLLIGCSGQKKDGPFNGRWSDERLRPVLDAQEHRDTDALCALLKHEAAEVREAAALAFASVQDIQGVPCLLGALADADAAVRTTAVFALGFVADSLTIERMAEGAMTERDSTVHRAYLSASFQAMQRNGMLKDPAAIIYFLQSSSGQDRVRAADAFRRLPDSVLLAMEDDYIRLVDVEQDAEVKAVLLRGMASFQSERADGTVQELMGAGHPMPVRIQALRSRSRMSGSEGTGALMEALADTASVLRWAALDLCRDLEVLDGNALHERARQEPDTALRLELLGLAARHGDRTVVRSAVFAVDSLAQRVRSPYLRGRVYQVHAGIPGAAALPGYMAIMRTEYPAPEQQAAFQSAVRMVRDLMARSRYATPEAQYGELRNLVREAIRTGDAGLICAALELVLEEEGAAVDLLLDAPLEQELRETLVPVRDAEAITLLERVMAKRAGLPYPPHTPPPFNHPIDKEKLRTLPQGQRYRITTTKGTIVIATDVNDCPGSSLAFDSLVTAGYYNGKAFHRMVPNFVVQGGCPRGDGYGGMPWTLRTEIGRSPFTAGSVGLASAGRDTESCQFFITHSATPHLDGRYTRFGEVVEGMDVVWRLQVGDVMETVERVE